MSEAIVGVYTIGQAPHADLTESLVGRFGAARLEIRGALDRLTEPQIPACGADGYPLETRLRDGTRVVVDAAFLEPHLQRAISEWDDHVAVHLVLCAGSFPRLTARRTVIQPFDVAVVELAQRGFRSLEVVVPFAAQATSSHRKWEAVGFACRTHVLGDKSGGQSVAQWLAGLLLETSGEALVLDYVGFPVAILDEVAGQVSLPVFDLGHLAADALERTLHTPRGRRGSE